MLYNYFKIALRVFGNSKAFSFINLLGLAVGMATGILILLWVQDELNYDNFHPQGDRVYRVVAQWKMSSETQDYATTPAPLAAVLQGEIPEIQDVMRFNKGGQVLLTYRDKNFDETDGAYADPSLFRLFNFPLVKGNPQTALSDPHSVVLSETLARKYFPGEADPMGKIIRINNKQDFTVTGVMRDVPANSHITFSLVFPFVLLKENGADLDNNWNDYNYTTYVQLHPGVPAPAAVDKKITTVLRRRFKDMEGSFYLEPLRRIYLYSKVQGDDTARHGDVQYVYIFSAVAVLILLIACINYMNLATARSAKRAKEVGLRKVAGAHRAQLIGQFLGESMLMACLALAVALGLVWGLLPLYNEITQKQLSIEMLLGKAAGALLGIALFTGLLAGSYPALMLSSFQPVRVLKGALRPGTGGAAFRKGLVVVQFTLSILLIISTIVIHRQMQYVRGKNLGYQKENILSFSMRGDLGKKYESVKNELLQQPGVLAVTSASQDLTQVGSSTSGAEWEGKPAKMRLILNQLSVDRDFTSTFNLQMVAGRGFSSRFTTDSAAFILNEEAVKQMGIANPVGKRFSVHDVTGTIVGVAKDFHFKSLHEPIEPLVLFVSPNWRSRLYVKVKPGYTEGTLAASEKVWKTFNPAYPFEYRFLGETFDRMYQSEQRTGRLFNGFSCIAIFIACLGLFGLAAFTAEQRLKEIGIRKVLGASVSSLVGLLSKEFVKLVAISFLLAVPLAWYVMQGWLSNFAYRISISWWIFALAGGLALLIALLTVSFQSFKAALTNPVKSLKSE